ncbi:MAG TPA: sulfatase [Pirellulales bacterium]
MAFAAALCVSGSRNGLATEASAPEHPNVVIIYCDDVGYADVGVFGAKGYTTPNLDRMAAEGVRFTRYYSAQPVCSASRTALLTGCYPNRLGIQGALGPQAKIGINADEMTLGELVKQQGYATAVYGKWHLGHLPQFLPTHNGFDEYFGLPYSNDMWPLHPDYLATEGQKKRQGYPDLPLIEGDKVVIPEVTSKEQRQLTTWYTEHAVSFIERNRERPFLLYVPHSMSHVPLHVSDKFQGKSGGGMYGDVMQEIDWSAGEILAALARNGLDRKTLVIFTSDNGPWLNYGDHAGSSGPLREGKGTCWEGGVREPFIARFPGVIPADTVCKEPAMAIDLFPTIAKLTGAKLPEKPIDGLDIWPLFVSAPGAKSPHEAYYFYYNDNELQAVMSGDWKLYLPHTYRTLAGRPGGTGGKPVSYESRKIEQPELYNVADDIGEAKNVAAEHPDIVARLLALAEKARDDMGDKLTQREGKNRRPAGRAE